MEQMTPGSSQPSPAGSGTGPVNPAGQKRTLAIAAVVALAVILIAAGVWWSYGRNKETSQEIAPGQILVSAQAGRVVSRFPQELILENSPEVLNSYRIEYTDGNLSQPFVRYVSGKSFEENVELFANYFHDNEWEMLRLGRADEAPATFFHGAKDDAQVNVIVSETDGKVEISIAYVLSSEGA